LQKAFLHGIARLKHSGFSSVKANLFGRLRVDLMFSKPCLIHVIEAGLRYADFYPGSLLQGGNGLAKGKRRKYK
jgi:hypothetical protein